MGGKRCLKAGSHTEPAYRQWIQKKRELFKKSWIERAQNIKRRFCAAASMRNRKKEEKYKIEKYVKINWKSIECDVKIKHFSVASLSHVDVNHFIRASALNVCSLLFSFKDQYLTILKASESEAKEEKKLVTSRRQNWMVFFFFAALWSFFRIKVNHRAKHKKERCEMKRRKKNWHWQSFFGVSLEFRVFGGLLTEFYVNFDY